MNDLIKRYVGDDVEADIPGLDQQQPIILLQALSPAVVNNDPKGARAGLYLGRLGDEQVLVPSFTCQLVGFIHACPEYPPDEKVSVGDHGTLPRGAEFHKAGGAYQRSGYYLANGHTVVPIVVALVLVHHNGRQYPSALHFRRSSYGIGRELYSRSRRLKAVIDGREMRGCYLGKYAVTAERDPKSGKGNFIPKVVLLGVVGEVTGPTLTEYRYASEARKWFKAGDDWALLEPPEPPPAEVKVIEAEPPPASDNPDMVPEGVALDENDVEEAAA